jgi:FO synthase
LQSPPNLNPTRTALLLRAGINDFGGISPVTPDYINPRHPWPHLDALHAACAAEGFSLRARPPIYDRFATPDFLDESLAAPVAAAAARLASVRMPSELSGSMRAPGLLEVAS